LLVTSVFAIWHAIYKNFNQISGVIGYVSFQSQEI
jgi:hypothetical protein